MADLEKRPRPFPDVASTWRDAAAILSTLAVLILAATLLWATWSRWRAAQARPTLQEQLASLKAQLAQEQRYRESLKPRCSVEDFRVEQASAERMAMFDAARSAGERALEEKPDPEKRRRIARWMMQVAELYREDGLNDDAVRSIERAIAILNELAEDDPHKSEELRRATQELDALRTKSR